MKKINTLKKNYEFKNVLNKGKFYKGKYITIYITKNKKVNVNRKGTNFFLIHQIFRGLFSPSTQIFLFWFWLLFLAESADIAEIFARGSLFCAFCDFCVTFNFS